MDGPSKAHRRAVRLHRPEAMPVSAGVIPAADAFLHRADVEETGIESRPRTAVGVEGRLPVEPVQVTHRHLVPGQFQHLRGPLVDRDRAVERAGFQSGEYERHVRRCVRAR